MIKELKIVFFILLILFFLIFTGRFYFSDENKKNTFRSSQKFNNKIENYLTNITLIESDTDNIIEYVESSKDPNEKKYHFWELLNDNEK